MKLKSKLIEDKQMKNQEVVMFMSGYYSAIRKEKIPKEIIIKYQKLLKKIKW